MNKQTKIAVFYGGKMSRHLCLLKKAAEKLEVSLDLISYNDVSFETEKEKVEVKGKSLSNYEVLFFRTTGKHWEEVNLLVDSVDKKKVVIVDPLVLKGRPSDACKAYQMLALKKAGVDVPKTIYGSLWNLYKMMKNPPSLRDTSLDREAFNFPIILKGSGGDRGTRVFKADNLEDLEKLVRGLRRSEIDEGRRYMLQEFIPNDGDYRILVLGNKVLGVMKRSSQSKDEFRNNYSMGGSVEVADLPEEIKDLAVKAAKTCGLLVAGVDVAFRENDLKKPVVWEVNKGPQFSGFMKATGIDVPREIVKFLVSLKTPLSR
jgi:ribosomal protein S6--L-glutamate ligase